MTLAARRPAVFLLGGLGAAGLVLLTAGHAQAATDAPIPAEVRFEVGPYNAAAGDWPITAVQLRGGLLEGKRAAVTLEGAGGVALWEGEIEFTSPMTRLVVDRFVAVRDLVRVSLAQQGFETVVAPVVTQTPAAVTTPTPAVAPVPGAVTPQPAATPEVVPPEVHAEIITRPLPTEASPSVKEAVARGTAAAPKLAVSLIVLLVLFAIVFRLPVVSAGSTASVRR